MLVRNVSVLNQVHEELPPSYDSAVNTSDDLISYISRASRATTFDTQEDRKLFSEKVQIVKDQNPEIPLSLIQYAKELDDVRYNASLYKRKRYIFKFYKSLITPSDDSDPAIYSDPYEILEDNYSGNDIIQLADQLNSSLLFEVNKYLHGDESDLYTESLKQKLKGKSKLEKTYKEMLKVPKFIVLDNHMVVDPSGNDRYTKFTSKNLLDLIENYYVPGWFFTRQFIIPGSNKYINITFGLMETTKVELSRIAILKIRLLNTHLQTLTNREIMDTLVKKKNIGIDKMLNFKISKNHNNYDSRINDHFCVVLMKKKKKKFIKFGQNEPVLIDDNIELTMIIPPDYYI